MHPILTELILLPILGALTIIFLKDDRTIRWVALIVTGISLVLVVFLLTRFDSAGGVQFIERAPWIPQIGVQYFLGVDGLSIAMVFLTALLGFLACIASLGIKKSVKEYFIFYLLLMAGMMGTFIALDLILFYIFWELVLVPMYFLIGIWGGPRKEYAATKFFLYTFVGSVVMFVGILTMYFNAPVHTFDMLELVKSASGFDPRLQMFLFLAFYVAFAVKVPVFPFHTWLPDAHVEAPTPVSMLLAGVLLKMGTYAFLRISFPMLTGATHEFVPILAFLGAVNVIYGSCAAMAQTDFKKMVAYSSVGHMGFVMLGFASLNEAGINGAILAMFNHGIITGAMFFLVGVLYERAHTRDMGKFGGLSGSMPMYAFLLTFCSLASLGLPGLSGFVGEFLSLVGAYTNYPMLVIVAAVGLIITVGYFLLMIQRVLFGVLNPNCQSYPDMKLSEVMVLVPLVIIIIIVGVVPNTVLKFQETAVTSLVNLIK